jgi:hypothetical protein
MWLKRRPVTFILHVQMIIIFIIAIIVIIIIFVKENVCTGAVYVICRTQSRSKHCLDIPSKQIEIIQSNATMYFGVKIKDYIKSNT